MFVDSSALVSIIVDEPGSEEIAAKLARATSPTVSVVTQVETALSIGRYHDRDYQFGIDQVSDFIDRAEIKVVGVPADIVDDVLRAYVRFGKGTGHRAQLNFGDCFSYAFAKRLGVPLLFKGDDFSKTDIEPVA